MPSPGNPRHGSLQYWPHVRAEKMYARIRSWPNVTQPKLLGFMGYKAGMTHVFLKEQKPLSPRKGLDVSTPVTVIECPPMLPLSIRFYKNTSYGVKLISETFAPKTEKELTRKKFISKKKTEEPKDFDDVRLAVYTQPTKTGLPNKIPEIIELAVGGKTLQEKLEFAKTFFGKEIKVTDIFKEGQVVDTKSVSKGKGYQGPVKIYGVKIRQAKAEKTKRGPASLGSWKAQGHITWRVAHGRKHGFHQRTEHNKLVVKIGSKAEDVNAKGGFLRFGLLKNEYILIKGSVAGPAKRPIIMTEAIRPLVKFKIKTPEVSYISTESKQRR